MNKKKYGAILMIISMLLIGCSKNYVTSIYDDNKEISSTTNSFNLDVEEQSIDGQRFRGVIKKIEGMDTIWSYESDKDKELVITYLLNVTRGKFKLVLISEDNSVTKIIERTNNSDITDYATSTLKIKKGLNRIKVVAGKDTNVKFDITISNGEFKKIRCLNSNL